MPDYAGLFGLLSEFYIVALVKGKPITPGVWLPDSEAHADRGSIHSTCFQLV